MDAEQTILFPSIAQERLEAMEGLLRRFLQWHAALPGEGDRKPIAWFAHDVAGYFKEPKSIEWAD